MKCIGSWSSVKFMLVGIGIFCVTLILGYFVIPFAVELGIQGESKIVVGNQRYDNWVVTRLPLFHNIYLFNVTNPKEVVQGQKPVLQQVGPLVYQFTRQKYDVTFNENNGTVFYRDNMDYFFRPDLSNASLSSWITFMNIPFMGIAQEAMKQGPIARYMILETLKNYPDEQLYVNRTIGQILFEGYYVPFMKEFAELKGEEILKNNTFGLYHGQNGTDQGLFEIYTGVKHPQKFGEVVSWNGLKRLEWWGDENENCQRITGTDGGLFEPFANKNRVFEMFTPGLCRTIRFTYDSDSSVKGVPVLKFPLARDFLTSAKENPDNGCYCADPKNDFETCPANGIFQMSGCGRGPMALSLPHFYNASQVYVNQSIGLKPDAKRHEWAIYIEKYTSAPIKVDWRFQMNFELKPNKYFRQLKKIPAMMHPLFWVDQCVELPDADAAVLRNKLYGTLHIVSSATLGSMIFGGVISVLAIFYWALCAHQSTHNIDNLEKKGKLAGDQVNSTKEECAFFLEKGSVVPQQVQIVEESLKFKT